ncbi:MAG: hypothetical protein SH868_14240 [Bythopirellula sp.]|nr:hypothetical protein [Bythopirellula sp.]
MRFSSLNIALMIGLLALVSQGIYHCANVYYSQEQPFATAEDGWAALSLRLNDYPETYIASIQVDLTSPKQSVRLNWLGPNAAEQNSGPFHSSPGVGVGGDCNEYEESRRTDSCCTPKGEWEVAGFNDYLPSVPECKHVTWFHIPREVALHSHPDVPAYPASHGCVRLESFPAQLIHNNSIAGKTKVIVDGTWTSPPNTVATATDK